MVSCMIFKSKNSHLDTWTHAATQTPKKCLHAGAWAQKDLSANSYGRTYNRPSWRPQKTNIVPHFPLASRSKLKPSPTLQITKNDGWEAQEQFRIDSAGCGWNAQESYFFVATKTDFGAFPDTQKHLKWWLEGPGTIQSWFWRLPKKSNTSSFLTIFHDFFKFLRSN